MQEQTRRDVLRSAAGIGAASALAGCLGGGSSDEPVAALDAPEGTEVVKVGPNDSLTFVPGTDEALTVSPGTTVRFVWLSSTHNVDVTNQPEGADWSGHTAIEGRGFSFEFTFDVPGRYEYVCQPHRASGMVGTVVVEE
ncbi:plastocyanin/azurin family copper-binding protein [Halobacterium zhouii]|uniref:plastocyanin/azurin family copper-binding protein n=1 Tax=Halobacterium zhouii TaxID=2902624 RepID=UPI001E585AC9|nr:plastocyanin/azurin family copper-binding protein [Halobacterium zhouii]